MGIVTRGVRVGAAAAAAAGLGWMGYAAVAWSRFGSARQERRAGELLDRFLPAFDVRELHETEVMAPPSVTYAAATSLDIHRSAVVRSIFRGREFLMGAHAPPRKPRPFLEEIRALGWHVLEEVPGQYIVFGAATQPWQADVRFRGMPAEEFTRFDQPGFAKIAWTLSVEPRGIGASTFRTETRVLTTDPESRRRFRRYWSIFSPGILLIRYEMLRLVRTEAERRAARNGAA